MYRAPLRLWLTIFAILTSLAAAAKAETISATRYEYYPISGQTAAELYAAMLRRGPHVDGDKAYAATSATTSQQGKLIQADSCRVASYTVKLDFVIRLPRLADAQALTPADRRRFTQFATFLRRHEEQHRTIWLDCAAKLEAKASRLAAPTCEAADAKSQKLWTDMRKACSLRHKAFDSAEQKKLLQHPFVRYVLQLRARATQGAKAR